MPQPFAFRLDDGSVVLIGPGAGRVHNKGADVRFVAEHGLDRCVFPYPGSLSSEVQHILRKFLIWCGPVKTFSWS